MTAARMTKLQRLGALAGMVRSEEWAHNTSAAHRELVDRAAGAVREYLAVLELTVTADVVLAVAGGALIQAKFDAEAVRQGPLAPLAALMPKQEVQAHPLVAAVIATLAVEVLEGGEVLP